MLRNDPATTAVEGVTVGITIGNGLDLAASAGFFFALVLAWDAGFCMALVISAADRWCSPKDTRMVFRVRDWGGFVTGAGS